MDSRTATAIGFLAGKMLEAHKTIELEERLSQLEKQLQLSSS